MYFPPLHPAFVNFTAALIPVSFFSDLLGRLFKRPSLEAVGWWTLLWGAAMTPLTIFFGYRWMKELGAHGRDMTIHQWLGYALGVGLLLLTVWRGLAHRAQRRPSGLYLVALFVLLLALIVQGHEGGTMSFPNDSAAIVRPAASMPADGTRELGDGWRSGIPF
jgi:uncharacterized membrane protein